MDVSTDMDVSTETRTAASVLEDLWALITTDTERWLELFAEDGMVEFPYAGSLGSPGRLEGKAAIRRYFTEALKSFEGLEFTRRRKHLLHDPDLVIAEVHGSATITTTGRRYEQDYVMVLQTRAGKIVLYREYWDPMAGLAAFGPAGGPLAPRIADG
ncbi:nuclear transport factor 2 family protein [Chondromyces crocatus]|uniref:SnoaL-like domain-containing protein n=1 Tax=Chondromyces crocatus TaxID=52 RepID=A0A0K1EM80_CHOCO|nr:nuclear transport factor 2 family protein [Chondromyces crocatus]AKT41921.1 uncharacterized protein CMC5_061430 [Chondromyces crocatus]